MKGANIHIECPPDKLAECLLEIRDIGFTIEITWDGLIEKWIVACK